MDPDLVRRLVADQVPEWTGRQVRPMGTDNAFFRLGEDLVGPALAGGGPLQVGAPLSLNHSPVEGRTNCYVVM